MQNLTHSQLYVTPQDIQDNQTCLSIDPAPPSLTTEAGIGIFLRNTPFNCEKVTKLDDGDLDCSFRICLRSPFQGCYTAIVKRAKLSILVQEPARYYSIELFHLIFGARVMVTVRGGITPNRNVTVPKIYRIFDNEKLIIMEDFGSEKLTLERFILRKQERACPELTKEIGEALGRFLSWFHTWSTINPGGLLDLSHRNSELKESLAKGTTACLGHTLLQIDEYSSPKLSDPPFELKSTSMESVLESSRLLENDMLSTQHIIINGSFLPENIIVELDPNQPDHLKRLVISDWGCSTTGSPGFDLGMFCSRLHLFMSFSLFSMEASWNILRYFLNSYSLEANPSYPRDCLAGNTLAYWGTIMAWNVPSFHWIDKSSTRAIVEEGARWLVQSRNADFVAKSFVRVLLLKPENTLCGTVTTATSEDVSVVTEQPDYNNNLLVNCVPVRSC